ncbi:hypothetical protein LguiB_012929 [Lonicera macranthoides]
MHRPSISQHVDNLFSMVGMSHPSSSSTPTINPPVILCDKFGKELAKGSIVTDATAGICHFKQVGKGEKRFMSRRYLTRMLVCGTLLKEVTILLPVLCKGVS